MLNRTTHMQVDDDNCMMLIVDLLTQHQLVQSGRLFVHVVQLAIFRKSILCTEWSGVLPKPSHASRYI